MKAEDMQLLRELSDWLELQTYQPYQQEFNKRCIKWKETIDNLIDEDLNNE